MIEMTIDQARKMKVDELKAALKNAGASISGKKADLLERLETLINDQNTSEKKSVETSAGEKSHETDLSENPDITNEESESLSSSKLPTSVHVVDVSEDILHLTETRSSITHTAVFTEANLPLVSKRESVSMKQNVVVKETKPILDSILGNDEDLVDYNEVNEIPGLDEESAMHVESTTSAPITIDTNEPAIDVHVDEPSEHHHQLLSEAEIKHEQLSKEKELKYRLLAMKVRKDKTATSPRSRPVSEPINEPSCHVRVDHFQRPFTIKGLHQWLEETCGMSIPESSLWLNSIKTHCYIDFSSIDDASNCIATVNGHVFPATNTTALSADYTSVKTSDASTSEEAKLKPGEWKTSHIKTTRMFINTSLSSTKNAIESKSSPRGTGAFDMMKKAAQVAADSAVKPLPGRQVEAIPSEDSRKRPAPITSSSERQPEKMIKYNEKESGQQADVSLDTLFRKTKAQPSIYWIPVSDEIAAQRKAVKKDSMKIRI